MLLYHISQSQSLDGNLFLLGLAHHGWFGVQIFFVLSGFLITWLILREESQSHGDFSLASFYGRRALRILPPALFYLLVVAGLKVARLADTSWLDLTASALFFRNLVRGSTETGHYWTLSIEEQFYLLWPFLLIAIRNNKRRMLLLVALIAVAPVWRHLNFAMAGGAEKVNTDRLDLRYDPLVLGCLLALLRFDKKWLSVLRCRFVLNPLTALGVTFVLLCALLAPLPRGLLFMALPVQCSCVALLVSYLVDRSDGWVGTTLNWPPIVWIGTLSYSLYLWNELFLKAYPASCWIRAFPQSLLATLSCAGLSYYLLEKPFARLRRLLFPQGREKTWLRPARTPQRILAR